MYEVDVCFTARITGVEVWCPWGEPNTPPKGWDSRALAMREAKRLAVTYKKKTRFRLADTVLGYVNTAGHVTNDQHTI